eukprot:jgi/Botrbrau1/21387/Bobra.0216s0007.2
MSAAEEHSDNGKAGDNKKEDADSGTNIPATARRNTTGLNWADATEQGEDNTSPTQLPEAPSRQQPHYYSGHQPQIYKINVTNLPWDATAREVGELFYNSNLQVLGSVLNKYEDTGKIRGCVVELETHDDVIKALDFRGQLLRGRPLKIDVISPVGPGGRGQGPGRSGYADREANQGRRFDGPAHAAHGGAGYHDRAGPNGYGGEFGRNHERGGGPDRGRSDGYGAPHGPRYNMERGGFHDRERRGPHTDAGYDDRAERDFGGHNARDRSHDGRWGRGPPHSEASAHAAVPPRPPIATDEPLRERPKLNLQPRTRPLGEDDPNAPAPVEKKKVNPFGEAKPIDAAAKLREFEERLAKRKEEEAAARRAEREAANASAAASESGSRERNGEWDRQTRLGGAVEEASTSTQQGGGDRGRGRGAPGRSAGRGRGRGREPRAGRAVAVERQAVEVSDVVGPPRPASKTDSDGFQEVSRSHGGGRAWSGRGPHLIDTQGLPTGLDRKTKPDGPQSGRPVGQPSAGPASGTHVSTKDGSGGAEISNIFSVLNAEDD